MPYTPVCETAGLHAAGLVDGGGAVKLIAAALSQLRQDSSLQETVKAWRDTGLDLASFMPSVSPCPLLLSGPLTHKF